MNIFTALLEFFQEASKESFLQFWNAVPLQQPEFWHRFWGNLWTGSGPMNLISYTFWVFLILCAFFYYLFPKKLKPLWLLICSYGFYLYDRSGLQMVTILVGTTSITYFSALAISKLKHIWARRAFLLLSVCTSGGLLFYYKYANFLSQLWADILGAVHISVSASVIDLPVVLGLSFFTFQSMGYVIDVYQKVIPAEKNPIYYALYVSFFPCITSGPIERANHLLPQLRKPAVFNYDKVAGGLYRILWGVFKKMVIAGNLDIFSKEVFTHLHKYNGGILALAALVFSYQLYLDFSGYCDIAVGAGKVLGFDLIENFNRPFAGRSYSQLWDRWHISLTTWFRDYIFTPLSFYNRGLSGVLGKLQGWFNVFIIFPISGLWHGDNMGYVVWGVLNGLFMVVGKATAKKRRQWAKKNILYRSRFLKALIQCSCVYLLFTICIVFFAASYYGQTASDGFYLFSHLFSNQGNSTLSNLVLVKLGFSPITLYAIGISALFVEIMEKIGRPEQVIRKLYFPFRWIIYYGLIFALLLFANFGASGFVYGNY